MEVQDMASLDSRAQAVCIGGSSYFWLILATYTPPVVYPHGEASCFFRLSTAKPQESQLDYQLLAGGQTGTLLEPGCPGLHNSETQRNTMYLLLLVVSFGLAGAYPLEDQKECQPHSRPWHVRLHGGGVECSGALIDPWWIVTSFSCEPRSYQTIASLGEHDTSVEEGTEQHIVISDVIRHSPYRSPLHSLTMVRLSRPARFNQHVESIALPTRCTKPGEICSVSGWGSTVPGQYDPNRHLKCLTVPVVDDMTCLNTFPPFLFWGVMVCAGQHNTDNCLTGSSNVMVCAGELQGVTWFNHGCEDPAHPTVYTKMCEYTRWIKEVMANYAPLGTTDLPWTTEDNIWTHNYS
ncbi:trypsinogen-like protein 3 [Anableps anableps]